MTTYIAGVSIIVPSGPGTYHVIKNIPSPAGLFPTRGLGDDGEVGVQQLIVLVIFVCRTQNMG